MHCIVTKSGQGATRLVSKDLGDHFPGRMLANMEGTKSQDFP
jgi:hypothetical protein